MSLSIDESMEVLDISEDKADITKEIVKDHYKNKVKEKHPDQGGSKEEFNKVKKAKNKLYNYIEENNITSTNNTINKKSTKIIKQPSIIDKLSIYTAKSQLLVILAGVFTVIIGGQYYPALKQITFISRIASTSVIFVLVGLFFIPIIILLDINYYDNKIRKNKYTNNIVIYSKYTLIILLFTTWGGLTLIYNILYLSMVDIMTLQVSIIWIYIVFRRM